MQPDKKSPYPLKKKSRKGKQAVLYSLETAYDLLDYIYNRGRGLNMKMFLFKSFCLLSVMFISVLSGIQFADNGIHQMNGGMDHAGLKVSLYQNKQPLSATDPFSHDIQAKQQKLEKMNAFNLFSFMGKKMSEGISNASAKILKSIANE